MLDKDQTDVLYDAMISENIDFWREPAPGQSADLMLAPGTVDSVSAWLRSHGVEHSVMVDNVQTLVTESQVRNISSRSRSVAGYSMNWDDYHQVDVINEFIEALADNNDFARIINIGQSYEGRDMKVLAIEKVRHKDDITIIIIDMTGWSRSTQCMAGGWYSCQVLTNQSSVLY